MKRIPLSGRSGIGLFALVDDDDYLKVYRFRWYALRKPRNLGHYVFRRKDPSSGRGMIYLHRSLMRARKGEEVDHKNGDGLDNRRRNLRVCTRVQNSANARLSSKNTSGHKGVSFDKREQRWRATIGNSRSGNYASKYYATKEEAALAYDAEAKKRWGEFARLNFPETVN